MSKRTFWDRLQEAMADNNLETDNLTVAANLIGKHYTAATKWRDGGLPRMSNAVLLANRLGVSVEWLLQGKGPKKPRPRDQSHGNLGNVSPLSSSTVNHVPLISWVQAGVWNEAVDMHEPGYAEDWEPVALRVGENTFALRVDGDSMTPEFPEGAIIIVDPSVEPQNGDFVIAKVRGSATFKKLVIDAGKAYLKPLNSAYRTMEMPEDGEIVGVVVSQNKRYR